MATTTPKITLTRRRAYLYLALACLAFFLYAAFLTYIALLATEILTAPPLLLSVWHVLERLATPFLPLLSPLLLALLIKVCREPSFPGKQPWVWTLAASFIQQLARPTVSVLNIYKGEASAAQVLECGLLAVVVGGEGMGVRWDRGVLGRFVGRLAEQKRVKARGEAVDAEIRTLEQGGEGEKGDVQGEERFVSVEGEKAAIEG